MIEGKPLELEAADVGTSDEILPEPRTGDPGKVRLLTDVWNDDRLLDARQLSPDIRQLRQAVMGPSGVVVAVCREQHGRLDLAEPIEHALHAEVGRAGRPHRADGG